VHLELTVRGRAILRRAPEPVQQRLIAAITALPAGRRALLARTLRDIATRVSTAAGVPAMFFEDRGRRRTTSQAASRSPGP
jgi:hypothetical protein